MFDYRHICEINRTLDDFVHAIKTMGYVVEAENLKVLKFVHNNLKTVTVSAHYTGISSSSNEFLHDMRSLGFYFRSVAIPMRDEWERAIEVVRLKTL